MASGLIEVRSSVASHQAVAKWKVKVGATVQANSLLAQMQSESGTAPLKSPRFGKVIKLCVEEGAQIQPGALLCEIEPCSHPIQLREMCAVCGADLRLIDTEAKAVVKRPGAATAEQQKQSNAIAIVHNRPDLLVSTSTGMELGRRERAEMLTRRKLVLLVDLDQTLVHTTHENIPADLPGVLHYQTSGLTHLHSAQAGSFSMWYHTKIRPNTQAFLERMSKLYELHIFTMGSRAYAQAVADALDSTRRLFARRILSRDECLDAFRKTANLRALFPSGDQLVAIIDDRDEVWSSAPNLVQVRPFVSPFDRLADSEEDASENSYLERLAEILERVHTSFYDEFDRKSSVQRESNEKEARETSLINLDDSMIPDLKTVIPALKKSVLKGTALVFSCVHPRNVDPQRCSTHRVALQLGASVFSDLQAAFKSVRRSTRARSSKTGTDDTGNTASAAKSTTDAQTSSCAETQSESCGETLTELVLVCGKYGSSKQHEARSLRDGLPDRLHVVTVEWLYETYFTWQRQSPDDFPVTSDYDLVRYCEMPEPFYIRNWQLRLERLRAQLLQQSLNDTTDSDNADVHVKGDVKKEASDAKETASGTVVDPASSDCKADVKVKVDDKAQLALLSESKLAAEATNRRLDAMRHKKRRRVGDLAVEGAPREKRKGGAAEPALPHFSDDQLAEMEREIEEALCEDDDDKDVGNEDDGPLYGEDEDVPLGWTADELDRVGRPAKGRQRSRVKVVNGDELKLGDTTTEDDDPDFTAAFARAKRRAEDEVNDESRLDAGVRLLMDADREMGDYACLTRMTCTGVLENDECGDDEPASDSDTRQCEPEESAKQ